MPRRDVRDAEKQARSQKWGGALYGTLYGCIAHPTKLRYTPTGSDLPFVVVVTLAGALLAYLILR